MTRGSDGTGATLQRKAKPGGDKEQGGGGRTSEREKQRQSAERPAKVCETLVQPIAGSDPTPIEERGLGGGGGGADGGGRAG